MGIHCLSGEGKKLTTRDVRAVTESDVDLLEVILGEPDLVWRIAFTFLRHEDPVDPT
jgi:hypothetical protein